MSCREESGSSSPPGFQSGSILVLASAFVFLMTYIALSAVDMAVVEARMADALRVRIEARTLLDGALRAVVGRERMRLPQALADGDVPVCHEAGFCDDARGWVTMSEDERYQVSYQTRRRGVFSAGSADRVAQSAVSSHVHYQSAAFEVDIRVRRRVDNATLARAAVGLDVSSSGRARE
ncbi:pilus assembly PilX N-terminal domain-containing protein [Chromatocurvus halotolerans]|uniref:Uncharacterized protein n=1 Tax=Chromatocurvus halotolerans TaxID=1132028 RepID=A0A4V2SBB5_9GAMM|nr:pilus assembly PilX N-terminal domain-containing protein [Chromatocurvus halotolerans]TCO74860.1 hypothetical protein EV688_11117 [Chromatocurvus halotolerans]